MMRFLKNWKISIPIFGILLFGLVTLLVKARTPTPEEAPLTNQSGQISLIRSDGVTIALDSLRGKVWVAYFFFTTCKSVCPLLTQVAASLVSQFKHEADFKVIGITTDPANDTPEVLHAFSLAAHADLDKWWFLTGDSEQMRVVGEKFFKWGFDPPREKTHGGHGSLFALVDRNMVVRDYYYSNDRKAMDNLRKVIPSVLANTSTH